MNPFAKFARGHLEDEDSAIAKDGKKRRGDDVEGMKEQETSKGSKRQRSGNENRLEALNRLIDMRENISAPIDLYGTDKLVDNNAPMKSQRFQALVAAMLSTQTKDEITAAAMRRLHAHPEGLSTKSVREMSVEKLDAYLTPVGFHKKKAEQLKTIATVLHEQFGDDVPKTIKELTALPGIGPKVARLTLLVAWNVVDGIIVDTHVHRISNRLGWVAGTKTADATRQELEEWVPREHWGSISKLMIGLGQTTCIATKPKCALCQLSSLCPSSR
ncbi:hypothetical protein LEN26_007622 [Aphanomyces euteiches]|nr:hypothetical protein AeMF1_009208 [Aphanomyces euteiches]KAH9131700.1 hypothetical protein LEN26_007622 [Aphanomyces euteiches]KAH9197096.1 hypothetical protein AeNC1_000905 [Aphanomyces euteiches]